MALTIGLTVISVVIIGAVIIFFIRELVQNNRKRKRSCELGKKIDEIMAQNNPDPEEVQKLIKKILPCKIFPNPDIETDLLGNKVTPFLVRFGNEVVKETLKQKP